ncbi:MAG: hypothetical protein WCP22_13370 [Chlamydiota bacterium]
MPNKCSLRRHYYRTVNFALASRNASPRPVIGFDGSKNTATISYCPGAVPGEITTERS